MSDSHSSIEQEREATEMADNYIRSYLYAKSDGDRTVVGIAYKAKDESIGTVIYDSDEYPGRPDRTALVRSGVRDFISHASNEFPGPKQLLVDLHEEAVPGLGMLNCRFKLDGAAVTVKIDRSAMEEDEIRLRNQLRHQAIVAVIGLLPPK